MFCSNCGKENNNEAKFCHSCGQEISGVQTAQVTQAAPPAAAGVQNQPTVQAGVSPKDRTTAILFCIFLGAHRIYVGKIGSGIAMVLLWVVGYATSAMAIGIPLTIGYLIWAIIDLVKIVQGKFTDSNGLLLIKK